MQIEPWYSPAVLASAAGALVSLVGALASAVIAHRQLRDTRDSRRPWIHVEVVEQRGNSLPNEIDLAVVNSGLTPALNVSLSHAHVVGPYRAETLFEEGRVAQPLGTVGPGSRMLYREYVDWSYGREMPIICHEGQLLCFGEITYKDVDGNTHETRFCFRYDVEVGRFFGADFHNSLS